MLKAIGFDAGPADSRRHRYAEDDRFRYWYPLVGWGYDPCGQSAGEQAGSGSSGRTGGVWNRADPSA